jgi:hypothetical protein
LVSQVDLWAVEDWGKLSAMWGKEDAVLFL